MDDEIKKVLSLIESNGFEAYLVGGYVRDFLLGQTTTDIDITTNALQKDLLNIFKNTNISPSLYGSCKLITSKYHFDITTYRRELNYNKGKLGDIVYTSSLLEDLARRDFTINTICMSKDGSIIDNYNALKDLKQRQIKAVGDANLKIQEDPLRILRALRLSIKLNFKIDKELLKIIINNIDLLNLLSYEKKKEELDRILILPNALDGLKYLKKIGVLKYLECDFKYLVYVKDLMGMYAQLDISEKYPFTKEERRNIELLKIIINNKKISKYTIYKYGLYLTNVAASILGIKHQKIIKMYEEMPIKKDSYLKISTKEIMTILNIEEIKDYKNKLIKDILDNKVTNEKEKIEEYLRYNYERN